MDDTSVFLDDLDEFGDMQSPMNLVSVAVIGACLEVHRTIGPGYGKLVYENALEHEFKLRNVGYLRNHPASLVYKGKPVGEKTMDFVLENMVLLNVKTVRSLRPIHSTAMQSYLKATGMRLGLIVNFNVKELMDGVKRVTLQ
jgi:GxxExxY protein